MMSHSPVALIIEYDVRLCVCPIIPLRVSQYKFYHHLNASLRLPTTDLFSRVVREHGGLVIADEVQSGLGRAGNNMWGFQDFGPAPDILTVGKPLGNGFPMGAVVCSREVSDRLGGYFSTFGGNPVACILGRY